jgi:hypothetical protein
VKITLSTPRIEVVTVFDEPSLAFSFEKML